MLIRVISSIVALPLLFFFVIMGGIYLEIGVFFISILALYEFFQALKEKHKPMDIPSYIFALIIFIALYQGWHTLLLGSLAIYIAVILTIYLFDPDRTIADAGTTMLGVSYITFFLYHVVLLSEFGYMIWFIFLASWGADTGAYFAGSFLGKRKLFPSISPKKTVEGAIGGVISAIILCGSLALYFEREFVAYAMVIGVVGSLISIVGDLIASKIKREMGIKDFGKIMPGHGGVLDRFDSLLIVTPFIFYTIKIIMWIK